MEAERFLSEWRKMCWTCGGGACDKCPANAPRGMTSANASETIKLVTTFSETHPLKTRLMDFNEKFPDFAKRLPNGCPEYLPWVFGYCGKYKSFPCAGCEHVEDPFRCWEIEIDDADN